MLNTSYSSSNFMILNYYNNSLFEYFLIDVQMDACMDTTRIVQAISSVQLFINRCLLNLESIENSDHKETGVSFRRSAIGHIQPPDPPWNAPEMPGAMP